ncbi:MAG: HPr kinase/phosphatase C-terminal domain-containing protein [Pseudomonadota bacterium]
MSEPAAPLHASCVALGDAGVLITGAAGSGKSTLALDLIARGAELVADDQVHLTRDGAALMAAAPAATAGLIEARGVGILRLPARAQVALAVVVDLDMIEARRLPPGREAEIEGLRLPLIHGRDMAGLAAILVAWLAQGGTLTEVDG